MWRGTFTKVHDFVAKKVHKCDTNFIQPLEIHDFVLYFLRGGISFKFLMFLKLKLWTNQ
jgi:hypothetical protein